MWRKQVEQAAAEILGGTSAVEIIPREIATPANARLVVAQYLTRWGHPEDMLAVTETREGARIERSPEWRGSDASVAT